jgi:hypothetical protein
MQENKPYILAFVFGLLLGPYHLAIGPFLLVALPLCLLSLWATNNE